MVALELGNELLDRNAVVVHDDRKRIFAITGQRDLVTETPLRRRMIEDMQIRNLTPNTQRVYVEQVVRFARNFRKSPLRACRC